MFAPVLPLLSQAQANNRYAISRHQAQTYASKLALTGDVDADLDYRLTTITSGHTSFSTNFPHLFTDAEFVVVEILDDNGNLMGISVADNMR